MNELIRTNIGIVYAKQGLPLFKMQDSIYDWMDYDVGRQNMIDKIMKAIIAEDNYIKNRGYDNHLDWLLIFYIGYAKCYKGHWFKDKWLKDSWLEDRWLEDH